MRMSLGPMRRRVWSEVSRWRYGGGVELAVRGRVLRTQMLGRGWVELIRRSRLFRWWSRGLLSEDLYNSTCYTVGKVALFIEVGGFLVRYRGILLG
jgi:hypothetical protein